VSYAAQDVCSSPTFQITAWPGCVGFVVVGNHVRASAACSARSCRRGGSPCSHHPPPPTSPRRFALKPTKTGRLVLARRLSHSGFVPFACHYGRHPRDTPGRLGPRNSHRTKHTPMRSSSSQADSAGSIPVTRSTRDNRCYTYESDVSLKQVNAHSRPKTAPVPLRVPLAILASAPGDCQFPS
jgi:hypothetical protein